MSRNIYLGMLFLLFLCSCASVPVNIDYDESIPFALLHKFAWAPNTPQKSNNASVDSDTLMHERLRSEIENWLINHGYAKTQPASADFLVTYRINVDIRTDYANYGGYYGYPMGGWGWGYSRGWGWAGPYFGMNYAYPMNYGYTYNLGTLTIDILDPKSNRLIWRGTLSDEVPDSESPNKKRKKMAWFVEHILKNFPPQKLQQ